MQLVNGKIRYRGVGSPLYRKETFLIMGKYADYIADATVVNAQDEWNDRKYLVGIWSGSGYNLSLYIVCAPDAEDVLDILANYFVKNNITSFFYPTYGMSEDEIQEAEEYGYAVYTEYGYLQGGNLSIEEIK